MERFFTEAYKNLTPEELENYHKTVFLNMDSEFAVLKRYEYYKDKMKFMGKGVKIGCGVKFVNPQYISLGDNVLIRDHCTLICSSSKGITLEENAKLNHGVYLDTELPDTGYINIGKRVYVGTGCCLHGHNGLEIGDDSLLAQNITITPWSHKFDDITKTIYSQGGHSKKIVIGKDCYIGKNVCVVYSADIGDGSVIGAGSVVVKTIPPFSVAVGVPAKVIRKRGEPSKKGAAK